MISEGSENKEVLPISNQEIINYYMGDYAAIEDTRHTLEFQTELISYKMFGHIEKLTAKIDADGMEEAAKILAEINLIKESLAIIDCYDAALSRTVDARNRGSRKGN